MAVGSIGTLETRGMFWIMALTRRKSRRLCWTHTGLGPMPGTLRERNERP